MTITDVFQLYSTDDHCSELLKRLRWPNGVECPRCKSKTVPNCGVYVDGDIHTNTAESAFSLLKRGITGTWHKISAKHLQACLDKMTFRFDRRKSSTLFFNTIRHMATADPLTLERLTKSA